jgi:hypothetical protein
MAGFDVNSLSITEATLPERTNGRTAKYETNPFESVLQGSWDAFQRDENAGRQVKVPKSQFGDVRYLIRKAAEKLGIGVRIVTNPTGEVLEKASDNKVVTVLFQAQKKRNYEGKKKNSGEAEKSAETSAAPVASE